MKAVPSLEHLQYLGTVSGPPRGPLGDPQIGNGVAIRRLDTGTLRLYLGSYNPVQILQGDIPARVTGPLQNVRAIGTLPYAWSYKGLAWDELGLTLYATSHSEYDADPAIAATLSRGHLDPITSLLVSEGSWAFTGRSDKMTDGGLTFLPDSTLGVGFGGYRSVVATGPASMGAALARCARPVVGQPLTCTPLLGYPYSAQIVPRMRRSTDFTDTISADVLYHAFSGYTTWADFAYQNAVWIETPGLSGLLAIWMRALGTVSYTSAQVRAEGWRYDCVSYGPEILSGGPQNSYQPAKDVPFAPAGVTLPVPTAGQSLPPSHGITGVTWEPQTQTLVVGIRMAVPTNPAASTAYHCFRVVDPMVPYSVTKTTTATQTVLASSAAGAIEQAETLPWPEGTASYSAVPQP